MTSNSRMIIARISPLESIYSLLDSNKLIAHQVIHPHEKSFVGNIYKGKVGFIHPNLKSAFIFLEGELQGFLPLEDVAMGRNQLSAGDSIVVQIKKEPQGTKGPKCGTEITITGRYLVYLSTAKDLHFSHKMSDSKAREHIKNWHQTSPSAKHKGFIVRTEAEQADHKTLESEAQSLIAYFEDLSHKAAQVNAPNFIGKGEMDEGPYAFIQSWLEPPVKSIIVNHRPVYESLVHAMQGKLDAPELMLYDEAIDIWDYYDLKKTMDELEATKNYLPSGGYINIEKTEAMWTIDINSGKALDNKNPRTLLQRTNLEAIDKALEQIVARNLGGTFVLDFINSHTPRAFKELDEYMAKALKKDRVPTRFFGVNDCGLGIFTRERRGPSLSEKTTMPCKSCQARGRRMRPEAELYALSHRIAREAKRTKARDWERLLSRELLAFVEGEGASLWQLLTGAAEN